MLSDQPESATVTTRKPLLRTGQVPTLLEIKNRMKAKFGPSGLAFDSFIQPCAEEAERMLYDLASALMEAQTSAGVIVRAAKYKNGSTYRICYYRCPACRFEKLRYSDRYCTDCGRPIEWKY